MSRAQVFVAALVVAGALGGAAYADREVAPAALGGSTTERVASGAWFCPHGGGPDGWEAFLQIANPGPAAAEIRVRSTGEGRPEDPITQTVPPDSLAVVPVPADGRERSSIVEWFGQWVAVGWAAHAGGDEGGVAAEPCAPASGDRWLLPDGSTETEAQDDFVVIMNPFARQAVVSVTLLSERSAPVQTSELTDVVLRPYRSMAVRLSDVVLDERTVSTIVEAASGRIVAATLGVSGTGGIRSTLGYLGDPPREVVFPGGDDSGRSDLAVMSTGSERVGLSALLLGVETEQEFGGLADASPPVTSGRTFTTTTVGPTSVAFAASEVGVAAVRRTFGVASDQGASVGGEPGTAWIVTPAVLGSPAHPGLALANRGDEPAQVTLTAIGSPEVSATVTVPPGATTLAPQSFVTSVPDAAVVATATDGTFVPAAASYSRGREGVATYAVALGIPIPETWSSA